jgi:hypothetical protein
VVGGGCRVRDAVEVLAGQQRVEIRLEGDAEAVRELAAAALGVVPDGPALGVGVVYRGPALRLGVEMPGGEHSDALGVGHGVGSFFPS